MLRSGGGLSCRALTWRVGNVILHWSPNLQNGEALPRPELTRIASSSRTGRSDWHRNQFVPLPSRPPCHG